MPLGHVGQGPRSEAAMSLAAEMDSRHSPKFRQSPKGGTNGETRTTVLYAVVAFAGGAGRGRAEDRAGGGATSACGEEDTSQLISAHIGVEYIIPKRQLSKLYSAPPRSDFRLPLRTYAAPPWRTRRTPPPRSRTATCRSVRLVAQPARLTFRAARRLPGPHCVRVGVQLRCVLSHAIELVRFVLE